MKATSAKKKQLYKYPQWSRGLCQCLLTFLGGWLIAGGQIYGQALPLGACFVAAQALGLRTWMALAGVVLGYFVQCEPAQAMEFSALAVLMPVTRLLFQGTVLGEKRWFLPLCCGLIAGIFGAVRLSGADELHTLLWLSKALLAGFCTRGFCRALRGNRRAGVMLAAALVLGLGGKGRYIDLGFFTAVLLSCLSGELLPAGVLGMAMDLAGGTKGGFFTAALILPPIFCSLLRLRRRELRALAYLVLPGAALLFVGKAELRDLTGIALGAVCGYALGGSSLLSETVTSTGESLCNEALEEAASMLELLGAEMPRERKLCPSETDAVFDGAAEQVCRRCAFFHRCWQNRGEETYGELSRAAEGIMQRGVARAEDFSKSFRESCCNVEGFLSAINGELDGMLYRRQYQLQLRESRRVIAREYGILADYLRAMGKETGEGSDCRYRPLVSICSASKREEQVCGDRGACFMGRENQYFILLCDGMGTGQEAAQISNYTVRLLRRLLCSGLAPESALQLLNGNMLLQGTGAFSTVDLLQIDLHSGMAQLYKWGAAPSYWRDGDEIKKIGTATPPPGVGVGENQLPWRYTLSLKGGEMLVLISDGAYGEETETAIATYRDVSPRELAALLIGGMQAEDDMTAIVISLRLSAS